MLSNYMPVLLEEESRRNKIRNNRFIRRSLVLRHLLVLVELVSTRSPLVVSLVTDHLQVIGFWVQKRAQPEMLVIKFHWLLGGLMDRVLAGRILGSATW